MYNEGISNREIGQEAGFITVYAAGSDGDAAPIFFISDDTQIQNLGAAALDCIDNLYGGTRSTKDSNGNVYTTKSSLNGGEVTIYRRDITSRPVITGPKTGLAGPQGIAVDSSGYIYVVSDGLIHNDGTPDVVTTPRITVYSPGSNGDVPPIASIGGTLTGLLRPNGIVLGPPMESSQ